MRRARQREIQYTLNASYTRQQQREYEEQRPRTKVGIVFDYIRSSFDDFVNSRIRDRLEGRLRANPTIFIPLDYNVENSILREVIRQNYPYITEEDIENWGPWTIEDNRELFKYLKIYMNNLFDLLYKNIRFEGLFAPPSFAYKVENKTFRVRIDRFDALENADWVDLEIFEQRDDNFHNAGSDVISAEYAEHFVNAFQLATEVGLIIPFINTRQLEQLPKLKYRPFLNNVVYRTRRSGAFYPFLLKEEYQFFYEWFKVAQISYDPNDSIYKEHCLIYAIKQLEMNEEDKEAFIRAMLEYTVEFKDNVKKKCKVTFKTLNDIFTFLQLRYNLFLKAMNSDNRFEYVSKFSRLNTAEQAYNNLLLLYDEEHYMVDFPLPFTGFFAKNFLKIVDYVNYKSRTEDNIHISNFFKATEFDRKKPRIRPEKPIKFIMFSELLCIAKDLEWLRPMDQYYYERLITLPILPNEEKILPQNCNIMNEQIKQTNPGYNKRYDKILYFDFESLPDNKRHIPFLIVVMEADYIRDDFPTINYNGKVCGDDNVRQINFEPNSFIYFCGWSCVEDFFNYLSNLKPIGFENMLTNAEKEKSPHFNILCYAHNLMYDGRFLRGHFLSSFIEKGNRCYQQTHILPNNVVVTFKDFLALTNTALKKLPKWYPQYFDALNLKKEIYFYDTIKYFVNAEATNEDELFGCINVPMNDYCELLLELGHSKEEIDEFLNIYRFIYDMKQDEWPENFDFMTYTLFYCVQDVKILKVCHQLFRHEVKHSILNLNIDYYLTSPALAKKWFEREIFMPIKWIFKVNSTLQEFILKACHGGRCMTARNRKYHVKENILNIDAVSLYPSAMSIMYIPKGKPSVIPTTMLNSNIIYDEEKYHPLFTCLFKPNQEHASENRYCSHFIVEIEIVSVGINRDFPTIVRKEKDGKHNTNTIGYVYCDNIMLEDMIKWHKIKYKIIRGVWWVKYIVITNKGQQYSIRASRDYSIRAKVRELFELRKQMKANKNPQEKIIKLLLNSGFGSMMQKPIKTDIIVCNKEGMENILLNESCFLKEYERVVTEHFEESDTYIVKMLADTSKHYNLAFLASLVLSYSKRLMNTLMYALEDENVPIYYTDTDSIHVNKDKFLEKIEDIERKLGFYRKSLIGTDLCQFHNDYDGAGLGIYDAEHPDPNDSYDLYACEGFYLSKKIYAERVRSVRYPDREGIFYRLKGVPEDCIKNVAIDFFEGDVMRLYEAMYNDYGVVFDIAKTKTVFRFNTDYIYNLNDFSRTIKCCYSKYDPNLLTYHNLSEPDPSELCIIEKNSIDTIIANSLDIRGIYPNQSDLEPDEMIEMEDEQVEIYKSLHDYNILITELDDIYQRENEDRDHTGDNVSINENVADDLDEADIYNEYIMNPPDETDILDDVFFRYE